MENNIFKNFMNLILILFLMAGLSICSLLFCSWYGCNSLTMSNFFRADLICNTCIDSMYLLKNYQISLYGSVFTLVTYKMTTLMNRASSPTQTYIFEDYVPGRNSPPRLKIK